MHFEILVEDLSGKRALDILIPKILGNQHSFRIINYRGVGRIPKDLTNRTDISKQFLLTQLPKLLQGYGHAFAGYPPSYSAAVIVVCDLDDKCLKAFRREFFAVLNACAPKPETRFCIAIEESEAWLLGDIPAVKSAYPKAKEGLLNGYQNDAICGSWELLADAVFRGGSSALRKKGWQAVGREKSDWAENITPHMDVDANASPSFRYFRDKLRDLTKG